MITAIATFKLPKPISLEQAKAVFASTAPLYQNQRGLVRKYYVLSDDGATAGGIYLWQSREDADSMYTDEWKTFVRNKYGSDPTLVFLETPVLVDNLSKEILAF